MLRLCPYTEVMSWNINSRSGFAGGAIKVKRTDIQAELEVIEYSPRSARLALGGDAPRAGSQFPITILGRDEGICQCWARVQWVNPVSSEFVIAGVEFLEEAV